MIEIQKVVGACFPELSRGRLLYVSVLRIYALAIGLFHAKLELRPYSIASRVLHCMRYALHNML